MQSIFKGRFQNWQKKLSKDKNKKSWLCVSRELITPCWFWAEERRLRMVSSHGVKGGSCLHNLVMISSLAEPGEDSLWDWSGRKGMSPAQITWRGWTHCLPWMKLNCLAPCCLQTPPPKAVSPCPSHLPATLTSVPASVYQLHSVLTARKDAARVPATVLDGTWKWLRISVNVVVTCQSSGGIESSSLQLWKYS